MPKLVDHAARREQIADAVLRSVARRGLEATTVREVAEEAGCSTGVLAHYFRDKKEMLQFALNVATRRATKRALKAAARRAPGDGLREVLLGALPLDAGRRAEWTIWVAFIGSATAEPQFAKEQEDRYTYWRATIFDLLRRAQAEGAVRRGLDLDDAADRIVADIDGLGIRALFDPKGMGKHRLRQLADAMLAEIVDQPASKKAAGRLRS